ncbi:type II toxin-antitoxin system RelE/ParE family toxin [Nostoc piscinale]|nr:type II toxin-antitoxin system RelE/ParE family toxin [Nostoc piscinale]
MTYRIEISPTAKADVENIFLWMKDYSVDQAHRWVRGCYEIMLTLENFPNR